MCVFVCVCVCVCVCTSQYPCIHYLIISLDTLTHASHITFADVLPQVSPVEDGCIFSYVIQLDMKGYVPLFFSNLIQTQHPLIISMLRRYLEGGSSHQQ